MRPRRITRAYIQICRRDNYVTHYEAWKFMQSQPEELLRQYNIICERFITPPLLNAFGCDSYSDDDLQEIIRIANSYNLQACYMKSWYLSKEGWEDFQKQWQDLQEPTPEMCRQLEMEQKRVVDHLLGGTRDEYETDHIEKSKLKELRQRFGKIRWRNFYEIGDRDGYKCRICKSTKDLTIDHIIPLSRGGTNDLENLQILCLKHNSQKGIRKKET